MDDPPFEVKLIEDLTSEHSEEIIWKLSVMPSWNPDFKLDEVVNSTIERASSPSSLDSEPTSLTPPSIKSSPSLELKVLPKHLKYLGE